jgi:two-component system phosphate regulon response regulator PhoB
MSARACGQTVPLRMTDIEILEIFAAHPGQIIDRKTLIEGLRGTNSFIDERTIDAHIYRLRIKLNAVSQKGFITTVKGRGYLVSDKTNS